MLSRISGLFKREDSPKPDIKDLLLQIKTLNPEEKQLIKNALDEPTQVTVCANPDPDTNPDTDKMEIDKKEDEVEVTTNNTETAPSYEYTDTKYKRRQD